MCESEILPSLSEKRKNLAMPKSPSKRCCREVILGERNVGREKLVRLVHNCDSVSKPLFHSGSICYGKLEESNRTNH